MTPRAQPFAVIAGRIPLRRGMLLLLLLALLPLGVLAVLQGLARLDRDAQQTSQRLREDALLSAFSERNVLNNAVGVLWMLADHPVVRGGDAAACSRKMVETGEYFPAYDAFALIDARGVIRCTSDGAHGPVKLVEPLWWSRVESESGILVTPALWKRGVTDAPGVWLVLPLREGGEFLGAIIASLDLAYLQERLSGHYHDESVRVMVLDSNGRPIVADGAHRWTRLDVSGPPGTVHEVRVDDDTWLYAVVPLTDGDARQTALHMAYMAKRSLLPGPDWWFMLGQAALPLLALLFAWVAILIGTRWGILRWLHTLRHLAGEYARGNYRARVHSFEDAPQELRDLAASLYRMAHTIDQRDRDLQESMTRQKRLARELNHRVKNNLQVVISLLSVQGRTRPRQSAPAALADARLRVGALALVHRLLYETDELAEVSAERLIGELCRLVEQHHGPEDVRMECDIAPVFLGIDSAVPLTLWTVEVLSDALERAIRCTRPACIDLTLQSEGAAMYIEVRDDVGSEVDTDERTALRRLLTAIGQQLGGTIYLESSATASITGLRFSVQRTPRINEQSKD